MDVLYDVGQRIIKAQKERKLSLDELAMLVHNEMDNTFSTARPKVSDMRNGYHGRTICKKPISVNRHLKEYFIVLNALGMKEDDILTQDLIHLFKKEYPGILLTTSYPKTQHNTDYVKPNLFSNGGGI